MKKLSKIKDLIKANPKSLKFKIYLYFTFFAIAIFVLLWFMQVIFLQSYYTIMKKKEVIRLSNNIVKEYEKGNFIDSIDEIAYKNSVNVLLVNFQGDVVYTSEISNDGPRNFKNESVIINTNELLNQLLSSNSGTISYTKQITKYKSQIFIYGMVIPKSNICLVMLTPIDPIDSTISVLKNQLIYITILSLVLSMIVSIFISKKLIEPISKINESTKELAKGNYNVVFEKCDYMELDNLATTLNHTTMELSKTDKFRKELLANVSHDLRTPLTMIKAYAEMIRDLSGDNKEKRLEHINVIINESNRLTRLINDMMDLSKLESGLFDIKKTNFDIVKKTQIILNNFNDIYSSEGYKFTLNSKNDSLLVNADETKIEQVLYNLITNAVKYSKDSKEITINIDEVVDSNKVKIKIIDKGVGIAQDQLRHIWDRYYKLDGLNKVDKVGSGLGLSIVKNIMIKHNQNYGVISKENEGSTFWFELDKV